MRRSPASALIGETTVYRRVAALAAISSSDLLVGLSDGSILRIDPNDANATASQRTLRGADGTPIVQLAVDRPSAAVYALRERRGVVRCWLPDCRNETRLETSSLQFIATIAVDAVNGFANVAANRFADVASAHLQLSLLCDKHRRRLVDASFPAERQRRLCAHNHEAPRRAAARSDARLR